MTDPIRAHLDEHHMYRGYCIGCVRRYGGSRYEYEIRGELDALRAVLDLCDDPLKVEGPQAPAVWVDARDVRAAIAAALGVELPE